MPISDKKIRLWVNCAVLIGVGMAMVVLLNEPTQHERAAARGGDGHAALRFFL